MPITFYGPGGTKMFFHEGTPAKCRKQVTRALKAHPNAHAKVKSGEVDQAAALLVEDDRPTSAHWLIQYCRQDDAARA